MPKKLELWPKSASWWPAHKCPEPIELGLVRPLVSLSFGVGPSWDAGCHETGLIKGSLLNRWSHIWREHIMFFDKIGLGVFFYQFGRKTLVTVELTRFFCS